MGWKYDERQLAIIHKCGHQAFIILMMLMAINAFVTDVFYAWADITVSTFIIIIAVVSWYGVRTIIAGAYFTANPSNTKFLMIYMSIISFIYTGFALVQLIRGHLQLVEDGMATYDLLFLLTVPMFIFLSIASAIDWVRRGRTGE